MKSKFLGIVVVVALSCLDLFISGNVAAVDPYHLGGCPWFYRALNL